MEESNIKLRLPEEFHQSKFNPNVRYCSAIRIGGDENNELDFEIKGIRVHLYPKKVQDFIHFTSVCIDDKEDDKIVHYILKDYEGHTAHKTYRLSQITDKKIRDSFSILRFTAYEGYINTTALKEPWYESIDIAEVNIKILGINTAIKAEILYRELNNLEPFPREVDFDISAIKNINVMYNFQVNEEDEEE